MRNQYALEWSQSENHLHIQPLESLCAKNQQAFMDDKRQSDYVVIMIGEEDAITRMHESWFQRIEERDRVRNLPRIRATR